MVTVTERAKNQIMVLMEKEGIIINWIDGPDFNKAKGLIEKSFT